MPPHYRVRYAFGLLLRNNVLYFCCAARRRGTRRAPRRRLLRASLGSEGDAARANERPLRRSVGRPFRKISALERRLVILALGLSTRTLKRGKTCAQSVKREGGQPREEAMSAHFWCQVLQTSWAKVARKGRAGLQRQKWDSPTSRSFARLSKEITIITCFIILLMVINSRAEVAPRYLKD